MLISITPLSDSSLNKKKLLFKQAFHFNRKTDAAAKLSDNDFSLVCYALFLHCLNL